MGLHWDVVGDDVRALWEGVSRHVDREVASSDWLVPLTALQIDVMQHEAAHGLAWPGLAWEHADRSAQLSDRMGALPDAGAAIDGGAHRRNIEATRIARRRAETLFAHHDVLLAPSAAGEAGLWEEGTGDPLFGRAWTLLGLPCLHLPLGVGPTGLPIGLQVVGAMGDDARVLRAGAWLQSLLRDRVG